ncbi:hypothetical protein ACIPJG_33670 [Streptomyces halstedii]|uniref:hypothetical protein n=1 Tax=Streptomyces halstedii TaxID=1944 RepID=UPI0037F576FE
MTAALPCDAELLFVEAVSTGTVHIAVRYRAYHLADDDVTEVIKGGSSFVALAISPTTTRCGKRTFPQFERDHIKTARFNDDQLCRACYRTLHPDDQERAFEHDVPEPTTPAPAAG